MNFADVKPDDIRPFDVIKGIKVYSVDTVLEALIPDLSSQPWLRDWDAENEVLTAWIYDLGNNGSLYCRCREDFSIREAVQFAINKGAAFVVVEDMS